MLRKLMEFAECTGTSKAYHDTYLRTPKSGYTGIPVISRTTIYFRLFFRIFYFFHTKKFYKKKVCLPTDPKNFGHVTGNQAYFSFGLGGVCLF